MKSPRVCPGRKIHSSTMRPKSTKATTTVDVRTQKSTQTNYSSTVIELFTPNASLVKSTDSPLSAIRPPATLRYLETTVPNTKKPFTKVYSSADVTTVTEPRDDDEVIFSCCLFEFSQLLAPSRAMVLLFYHFLKKKLAEVMVYRVQLVLALPMLLANSISRSFIQILKL